MGGTTKNVRTVALKIQLKIPTVKYDMEMKALYFSHREHMHNAKTAILSCHSTVFIPVKCIYTHATFLFCRRFAFHPLAHT